MFRNLSIRSRLVGLLAVPVAGVCLLGGVGVAGGVAERAGADRDRRLAVVAGLGATAVHELQEERVLAAAWVPGRGRRGEDTLRARRRRADRALASYRAGAENLVRGGGAGDPALGRSVAVAGERLDRLAVVRAEADRRLVSLERTVTDHDAAVAALLEVTRMVAARLEAPGPARTARLLQALAAAKEASGRERTLLATIAPSGRPAPDQSAGPAGTGRAGARVALGGTLPARLGAAAVVARHDLDAARAAAGEGVGSLDRALAAPGARGARRLELALLEPELTLPAAGRRRPGASLSVAHLELLRTGLAARAGALRRAERAVVGDLVAASTAWQRRQETRLRTLLLALVAVALLTPAAAWLLLRVPAGRPGPAEAAPAPETVVGLARRGRATADRQLQLLDELEREEPDPNRRDGLLRLHHLATRLRRNAATLLTLSGAETWGRPPGPAPVVGLLRAAAAEADAGRRIDLLATDEVEVAGPVAADLVHLVAELLDNAAAFSPPSAAVTVTGAGDDDGYLVEITDRGLGMTDEELAWANQRLGGRQPSPFELSPGDRLGLTVAGRLAGRHGLAVRLTRSPAGGITAAVRLPAALLVARAPAPAPAHRA